MTKSFKGKYVSFWERLFKKLAPIILMLLVLAFQIEYRRKPMFADYKLYWYVFIIACFLIGLFYHIRDIRTVVTEVSFTDDNLQVSGLDFNSKFQDILNVNDTLLEIKQKENKESRIYIEIYSNDKYYYVNSYSDWQNETMVDLINEFNSRTTGRVTGMELFPLLVRK